MIRRKQLRVFGLQANPGKWRAVIVRDALSVAALNTLFRKGWFLMDIEMEDLPHLVFQVSPEGERGERLTRTAISISMSSIGLCSADVYSASLVMCRRQSLSIHHNAIAEYLSVDFELDNVESRRYSSELQPQSLCTHFELAADCVPNLVAEDIDNSERDVRARFQVEFDLRRIAHRIRCN